MKMRIGAGKETQLVLLHKRRVSEAQAAGETTVFVCRDCKSSFGQTKPVMSKYALADHLWLGRLDPVFRDANLAHQMLLALARVVTTKVVLRPESKTRTRSGDGPVWDFLFHQTGMVGSAIVFGNASCKEAMQQFPPASVQDSFAVSFAIPKTDATACPTHTGTVPDGDGFGAETSNAQTTARQKVRGIAQLKMDRREFER